MRNIDIGVWTGKALTAALLFSIGITSSMVVLASPRMPIGELVTSERGRVLINGEEAYGGRSVMAESTVSTPPDVTATLALHGGKRVQLAPETTFLVGPAGSDLVGSLTTGSITSLGKGSVKIRGIDGGIVELESGETLSVNVDPSGRQTSTKRKVVLPIIGAVSVWAAVAIIGGVALGTVLILDAAGVVNPFGIGKEDDDNVSPVR
jgi:hypothetical protein